MSRTPRPSDVEVSRALNALVATLNDRRVGALDASELQRIVTGALGGEQRIVVRSGAPTSAELTDAEGKVLARITSAGGRWHGERVGAPLSGGYVPSSDGGS